MKLDEQRSHAGRPPRCADSIIDVIGNTPMVELQRIGNRCGIEGRLLAKLDYLNPGFSKKDRIAREMMLTACQEGRLAPGQTVVELTSGNTGTGLALVCRALGHPFVAVMSKGNTRERARMMQALGAEVVLVDQAPARRRTRCPEKIWPSSRRGRSNWCGSAGRSGPISSNYRRTCWPMSGTRGRRSGSRRRGKWMFSSTTSAPAARSRALPGSLSQRSRPSAAMSSSPPPPRPWPADRSPIPATRSRAAVTAGRTCRCSTARSWRIICASPMTRPSPAPHAGRGGRHLWRVLLGAHLAAALHLLRQRERGATIAFLICDSGLKYLSTDLFPSEVSG